MRKDCEAWKSWRPARASPEDSSKLVHFRPFRLREKCLPGTFLRSTRHYGSCPGMTISMDMAMISRAITAMAVIVVVVMMMTIMVIIIGVA